MGVPIGVVIAPEITDRIDVQNLVNDFLKPYIVTVGIPREEAGVFRLHLIQRLNGVIHILGVRHDVLALQCRSQGYDRVD